MSITGYIGVGIMLMLYTIMNLQAHKQIAATLKRRWIHWTLVCLTILVGWPIFLVVGFSTYINEKIANW